MEKGSDVAKTKVSSPPTRRYFEPKYQDGCPKLQSKLQDLGKTRDDKLNHLEKPLKPKTPRSWDLAGVSDA